MSKVYIKYTGRVEIFVGNQRVPQPVWKERPRAWTDPKTGVITEVPGVPLVSMNGPFDMEVAQNFIEMRERENVNSISSWEIIPASELAKHTDVTENNVRG